LAETMYGDHPWPGALWNVAGRTTVKPSIRGGFLYVFWITTGRGRWCPIDSGNIPRNP
jgi:hypothetical protein